jgi:streptogramin lyase
MDSFGHVFHILHSESTTEGSETVTKDGNLLFEHNNKILELNSDGRLRTILTTDGNSLCFHSSHINGDILAGSYRKMTRYDRDGRELQVIKDNDKGQNLYGLPRYITENKNGDIWTSDRYKEAVIVVDKSGHHRFTYKGQQSQYKFSPYGICSDVDGHVLVCDFHNNSVHLLDQDGHLLSMLLTREKDGIDSPRALCVDDKHNLYLGQIYSKEINVYKYSQDMDMDI